MEEDLSSEKLRLKQQEDELRRARERLMAAHGRVAEVYEEVMNPPLGAGRVPIVINSMGLRPEALLSVWR